MSYPGGPRHLLQASRQYRQGIHCSSPDPISPGFYWHLRANGVDWNVTPLTLGPVLKMDPQVERFLDNDDANALLTRSYRQPFVVPEVV